MSLNDRQSVRLLDYLDAQFDAFTNDLVTTPSSLSSRLPLLSALHTLILNPRLSPTLLFPFLLRLSSAFHDLLTSYDLPSEFHDSSTRASVLDALRRLDKAWVDVLREKLADSVTATVPVTGTDRVRLRCVLRELRDALRTAGGRESKRVKVDVRTGEVTQDDDEGGNEGLGTLREQEAMQVDEERRDEEGEPDEQRMDDVDDDDDDDDDDAEFEEVDVLSPGGDDQELFSIHFKAPPTVPMSAPTPEPIPPKREPDEEEFGLKSGRAGEKERLGVDLDEMEEEEEEEEGDGEELDLQEEIEKVFRRSLGILEEGEGRAE